MRRILLLSATTGYQIRMFGEAAERLGVRLVFATDRCDQLDDPWWDGAIPIRFHEEERSADAIVSALREAAVDGILCVGDRPTVIGAAVAQRLGLPGHPPDAAAAARDKRLTRERLRGAGLPVPSFMALPLSVDASALASSLSWPVVVKPAALSGSRGVIRANDAREFVEAVARVRRLLLSADVQAARDEASAGFLVEGFIAGREYTLEGVLEHGEFQTFAIFDKPDPLDGPFFEETIYVTPSRAGDSDQQAVRQTVVAAARALGLHHGPVHAECRVNADGVFVLEAAARPIGGLCARALRFVEPGGMVAPLEELLLRHAAGESLRAWTRESGASGVMMIPIPCSGIYRHVQGLDDAARVPGIEDIRITAKPDQQLVALPEGSSYLGFIFARLDTPAAVEDALRAAHGRLQFVVDRAIPVNLSADRR